MHVEGAADKALLERDKMHPVNGHLRKVSSQKNSLQEAVFTDRKIFFRNWYSVGLDITMFKWKRAAGTSLSCHWGGNSGKGH